MATSLPGPPFFNATSGRFVHDRAEMPTLNWIGKEAVVNHHHHVPFHLLKDVPELSTGDPGSGNLIVQGDNLVALKALLPYYAGQVKCIYIDPPYNTGEENWVYNDNVSSPLIHEWLGKTVGKEAEDLSRHDKWLCMMYPRLALLRQFLRQDGLIFVSIDDNEVSSMRMLLDDLFGKSNFVASVIWQKRTSPDARLPLGPAHDYILAYAGDINLAKRTIKQVPISGERAKNFKNPDNDPRGLWASVDLTGQTGHATPEQYYEITTPTGRRLKPTMGRCWAIAHATFKSLVADNRIWFGKKGTAVPRQKQFLSETEGVAAWTWWPNTEVGHNQEATKELNEILGRSDAFDNPKPSRLLQRIIHLATDKDSLILDSFAGSGTTGHAVLQLNKTDGGNRRFILVEMEPKIARGITAERVKRVAQGYTNAKGEQVEGLGGGFRFCELGEPLFDERGQIKPSVRFADLARHVYFTETGEPLPRERVPNSAKIGECRGVAIYLLFNGILGDKSANGGNILTRSVLAQLPKFDGQKVIYCAGCLLGRDRLQAERVIVRQTPYEIKVS
jgi:site-specific DNA-methyltransferase (adenine-specific)/adenine-specific DNA-methyltransferase